MLFQGTEETIAAEVIQSLENYFSRYSQDLYVMMISGGRTPVKVFKKFSQANIPWEKIHIFWMDERCVPLESDESNFHLAWEMFLEDLINEKKLPVANIHPLYCNPNDPDLGAEFDSIAFENLGGTIDILITGVGEDGHIGSLFPHHEEMNFQYNVTVPVFDSPKLPQKRITFSRKMFESAKQAYILFLGQEKKGALEKFLDPKASVEDCPAKLFQKVEDLFVYTDQKY